MKPVAILGTGPAGLMAAQACALAEVPYVLFGLGAPSQIGGAQFLHHAIPGINDETPDGTITYRMVGSPFGYKEKVYGDEQVSFVSASNIKDGEQVPAWSLQETYARLLSAHAGAINQLAIDPMWVDETLTSDRFRLIVSTIPRPAMCLSHAGMVPQQPAHAFVSQPVRIANEAMMPSIENVIFYDGTPNVSWYRTANIFGCGSTEWGDSMKDRKLWYETVTVRKPLHTTCVCFDALVLFTGRYGKWQKGKLAHEAFVDTWKALQ
jgi:hypothetical protein